MFKLRTHLISLSSSITIGDWADGSLFAQLLQSKDPNFQIPSPGATDRREVCSMMAIINQAFSGFVTTKP